MDPSKSEDNPHLSLPTLDFDRQYTIEELLAGINLNKLIESLAAMINSKVCILSKNRNLIGGQIDGPAICCMPLRLELEVIGYLSAQYDPGDKMNAAVTIVELLLASAARYQMASALHLQAIQEDYTKLQHEHTALVESEERYKDLSAHLEQRVAEQVKTIEATQMQLYQAEKMASIGQLAAGVAHEVNNPMGFITSNLATARKYVNDFTGLIDQISENKSITDIHAYIKDKDIRYVVEDFQVLLRESIDGASRVSDIVKNLKGFSNIDQHEQELADVNHIIKGVCEIANTEINKKADLALKLGDLPKINCSPGYLGQVFLNILKNAVKAIQDKGVITILTSYSNEMIMVKISDTGIGMTADILNKIFDPFFTTNDVGDGTGLGLTVSRDVIVSHGGTIDVESTLGDGTIITIMLPINNDNEDSR